MYENGHKHAKKNLKFNLVNMIENDSLAVEHNTLNYIKTYPKVLFLMLYAKKNKEGACPINCRITLCGKNTNNGFSTGISVPPKKWNKDKQEIKGEPHLNDVLADIVKDISSLFLDQKNKGVKLTAKDLQTLYKNKSKGVEIVENTTPTLLQTYELFIEHSKIRVQAREIKQNTCEAIKSKIHAIKNFLTDKQLLNLNVSEVDIEHFDAMKSYLLIECELEPSTTAEILSKLKACMDFAVSKKFVERNLIEKCKKPKFDTEITDADYLNAEELQVLERANFLKKHLQKTLDFAKFICYTGFAYIDYYQFSDSHIRQVGNTSIIDFSRHKSNSNALLPLLPQAKAIIEKYEGVQGLPKATNQMLNINLKVIADAVGITKNLHCHLFRTTFGVHALNYWGVPLETVSAMMGHKSVKTTQKYYVKVLEEKVLRDTRHLLVV